MFLKIFYTSHLYVQAFKVKRWKNAETSKENKCLSEVFTNHRRSSPEILEFSCSEKFKNILRKTSMVVYFELILAKKTPSRTSAFEIIWEGRRDGFLFYRWSRSKLLE